MSKAPLIYVGILLTVLAWGSYGPVLHKGQANLDGNRLKPLMCVGLAYLVVAVLLPAAFLALQGKLAGQWTASGIAWSTAAGVCGTLGAFGIILAMTSGGKPPLVMPLVFGCAPIMTVIVTMIFDKVSPASIRWQFLVGILLVSIGAGMVLKFAPKSNKPHGPTAQSAAPADHSVQ